MTDESETAPEPESPSVFDLLDLDAVADEIEPDVCVERDGVIVTGTDAQTSTRVDLQALCLLGATLLTGEDVSVGRVDIHLVDIETIAELNAEHLDAEGPTDVVAFPLGADDFVDPPSNADLPPLLGDVVIAPEVAARQADERGSSLEAEMALLTVHGILHVLGHDHADPDEAAAMRERERRYLRPLLLGATDDDEDASEDVDGDGEETADG